MKTSDARLFADDCLLYRHIRNDKDSVDLQTDLSALEEWETEWQMLFYPEKCSHKSLHQQESQEKHLIQAT